MKKLFLLAQFIFAFICILPQFTLYAATESTSTSLLRPNVALCVACHGEHGKSPNPQWPHLAGQHANYLFKQLQDYKKGITRNVPTMNAIVSNLSEQEMVLLASFFSKQPLADDVTPKKYLKRGELIYRGGDIEKHISACIACHGPDGRGNSSAGFPVLSGQYAAYTIQQLQAFKDKKRSNDLNSIMQDISARMSADDIEAVAYYIQGLH